MLQQIFDPQQLPYILLRIPCILIALSFHELAHGWMAYKLGDPTARNFGRLSMNPLKHLDPIGALAMLLLGFGWAKPVPINTRYFKKPRRDMALSALAGPVANLILAFIGCFIYYLALLLLIVLEVEVNTLWDIVLMFIGTFYSLNLGLAVFNLLPIPPLDGSRIAFIFLPDRLYFKVMQYEQYISIALMLLLFTDVLNRPISTLIGWVDFGMSYVVSLILPII